jgi:glutamate-1-semialdehyde 2,1-aminomutase
MELVAPVGPVYQAGTLAGHPLAMVAGEATLAALDDGVYERLEVAAGRLERGLMQVAVGAACLARVGSLVAVFFRAGPPPRDADEVHDADAPRFAAFHAAMTERRVLLPPSQYEAWFVAAAHRPADIDGVIEAARAFRAAARREYQEGSKQ